MNFKTMKTRFITSKRSSLCLLSSSLFAVVFTCSALADGLSQFKDFISNPPPIKKMVFAQSGNLLPIQIGDAPSHDTPGFVLFESAMQSNSWYVEVISNAPSGNDYYLTGNGFVVGKSFTNYWSVYANKTTIGSSSVTADTNTPLNGFARIWLRRAQEIQKLGLVYLEPSKIPDIPQSIEWVGNLTFEAKTTRQGTMSGKIVDFTNGFPEKVEFVFSEIPNTTFSIVYAYEAGRAFPPHSVTAYKTAGNNTEQLWKFLISDIETGNLGSDFNGFSPNSFMSSNQLASARTIIEEGENVAVISSNGIVKNVPRQEPNYSVLEVKATLPQKEFKMARIFIWFFMAASVAALFWVVNKQTNK